MSEIIQTPFDYGELSTEIALELRLSAERIRTRMKRTAEDIVEIGKELISCKAKLDHGEFGDWLKIEFDMAERTARNFMQVAEQFGSKSAIIADFSPTILYLLAEPKNKDVRETVIEQVTSGEIAPNVRDVKIAIDDAKAQARIAREALERTEAQNRILQHQLREADYATKQRMTDAQNHIDTIARQLKDAQAQIANYTPQVVTETVEVVPSAITAKVAQLEAELSEAKEQRKRISEVATKLQTEAQERVLRDFANADDQKIRNAWFSSFNAILKSLRTIESELPPTSSLHAFEPVDWQRLREVYQLSQHVTHHIESLLLETNLTIIDAEGEES